MHLAHTKIDNFGTRLSLIYNWGAHPFACPNQRHFSEKRVFSAN